MTMRCDSHVHVVGPTDRYPQVVNRTYTADLAPLETLERIAAPRNVRRFVIVQPSFYGADNLLLLETLDALAERGRGVAVIDPKRPVDAPDYNKRGVRGLRINLYSPLGAMDPLSVRFRALEDVARTPNWHVEVIAPLKMIAENADLLRESSVPVVIDHYGLYGGFAPDSGEGRALIELLRLPHVWMKLSAPYRVSSDDYAVRADAVWLSALLAAAPERCVWGSDWPHTPPHTAQGDSTAVLPYRNLPYERVADEFIAAVGSVELSERILTENAARLYGF